MASKEDNTITSKCNIKDLEVSTESMLLKFILHSDKVFEWLIFFFQRFADKEELLRNMMGLMVSTEFSQRRRKYILSNHYCVYDFLEILLFSNDLLVNFFLWREISQRLENSGRNLWKETLWTFSGKYRLHTC